MRYARLRLLGITVLLLSGCASSGGGGSTSTPPPPPRSEPQKAVNQDATPTAPPSEMSGPPTTEATVACLRLAILTIPLDKPEGAPSRGKSVAFFDENSNPFKYVVAEASAKAVEYRLTRQMVGNGRLYLRAQKMEKGKPTYVHAIDLTINLAARTAAGSLVVHEVPEGRLEGGTSDKLDVSLPIENSGSGDPPSAQTGASTLVGSLGSDTVNRLLSQADRFKSLGLPREAWRISTRAIEVAGTTNNGALSNATAFRAALLQPLLAEAKAALAADKLEAARDAITACDPIVTADERVDYDATKAQIVETCRSTAKSLVEKATALAEKDCFKADKLLKRALVLDPDNEDAKNQRKEVAKSIKKLTPEYVKDLHAQLDGDGYSIYFTVANKQGEMIPAPGKVMVRIGTKAEHNGRSVYEFGGIDEDVTEDDYEERAIGGDVKLVHICQRIAFSELSVAGNTWAKNALTREAVREMEPRVKLVFKPAHGKTIEMSRELFVPK